MKVVRINPVMREIVMIEGNLDELIAEQIEDPQGFTEMKGGELGLIACPVALIESHLFWHAGLSDVFGGIAFVAGLNRAGKLCTVPEGAYMQTRRLVEFLGPACLSPRLRELVRQRMSGQRSLSLGEDRDLH